MPIRYYIMAMLVASALGRIMQACPYSSLDIRDDTGTHYERGNDNQWITLEDYEDLLSNGLRAGRLGN